MKKIALASAAMGGAALVAFGASGTFASFQDAETLTNQAGAGTLVLDARNSSVTAPVDALALNPGETARFAYYVQNDGNLAGKLDADFLNVVNNENGCVGPEKDAGVDGSCEATQGEFTSAATVSGYLVPVTGASQCVVSAADGRTALRTMSFAEAVSYDAITNVPVAAGQAACVILEVGLNSDPGNNVQSDSASFDVKLTLKQA